MLPAHVFCRTVRKNKWLLLQYACTAEVSERFSQAKESQHNGDCVCPLLRMLFNYEQNLNELDWEDERFKADVSCLGHFALNSLFVCHSLAGGEADNHRRGVPERSAQKAQRHLWEVRLCSAYSVTHTHSTNTEGSGVFILSISISRPVGRRRISRRKWTRNGKRRSTRPNLKTRMWQKSEFLCLNINN